MDLTFPVPFRYFYTISFKTIVDEIDKVFDTVPNFDLHNVRKLCNKYRDDFNL